MFLVSILASSGGFKGGHSRLVPPFLYMCPPPLLKPKKKKKKKKVSDSARLYPGCYLPPPPPPPDVDGAPEKKVSESPLYQIPGSAPACERGFVVTPCILSWQSDGGAEKGHSCSLKKKEYHLKNNIRCNRKPSLHHGNL